MIQLVQTVVLGLLIGGVYALMASGLTLVFGIMGIVNVAQGALLVLVAMVTWKAWELTGVDPILLAVGTTPAMFGLGWVLYRFVIVRVRGGLGFFLGGVKGGWGGGWIGGVGEDSGGGVVGGGGAAGGGGVVVRHR